MDGHDTSHPAPPAPQPAKVAPESVALRAAPRPVTRLNRRMLAVLTGGLAAAVLGATIWSLQTSHRRGGADPSELYNVDRVSKSEGLDRLPADYAGLRPPPAVPQLGPPLPGDLGPAIVKTQGPVEPGYAPPGHDPADALRKETEAAAGSPVFFRTGGAQAGAGAAQPVAVAAPAAASGLAGLEPMAAGPASTAAQATDPTAVQNRQEQKEAFLKGGSPGASVPTCCCAASSMAGWMSSSTSLESLKNLLNRAASRVLPVLTLPAERHRLLAEDPPGASK